MWKLKMEQSALRAAVLCPELDSIDALHSHTCLLAKAITNSQEPIDAVPVFISDDAAMLDTTLSQFDCFVVQHTWLLWGSFSRVLEIVRRARALGPTIVHFHDPPFPPTSLRARIRRQLQGRQARALRAAADNVSCSLPPTAATWLGDPQLELVVPTSSNFEDVTPSGTPERTWDVAVIPRGSMSRVEVSALEDVLCSTARLLGRTARLVLVGRSSEHSLEMLSNNSAFTVQATGPLEPSAFVGAISKSSAVLQPFEAVTSRSGVAACAMSMGVPVVGWVNDRSTPALRATRIGLLDARDNQRLAEQLATVISDVDRYQEIGRAQHDLYWANSSWNIAGRTLASALLREAARRGRAA